MELPLGTLLIHVNLALSSLIYTPKEAPKVESTQVCWVTLWPHGKVPMVHQVREQPRLYLGGLRPWRIRLS